MSLLVVGALILSTIALTAVDARRIKVPRAPFLTVMAGDHRVDLTWTTPQSNGASITQYRIYRGPSAGSVAFLAAVGAENAYADASALNGVSYFYQVSAVNSAGEGSLSNTVSATPFAASPPAAPALTATPGDARVVLSWTTPASNGGAVTGYKVYRGTTVGNIGTLVATLGAINTYTDTGRTNGVLYHYQVTASNGVGEGPRSNTASATPTATPNAQATVVLTFDDGYASHYTSVRPTLEKYGMRGTFYVVTEYRRSGPYYTDYMSGPEVADLAARGHDVESHTVTHPDLTTLSSGQRNGELGNSQTSLQTLTGKSIHHLAYPYGAYDNAVISSTQNYYATARGVTSEVTDTTLPLGPYEVPGLMILRATSLNFAKGYIDYAVAHEITLVLVFHRVKDSPDIYDWTPAQLDGLLAYIATQPVNVRTMAQVYG